MNSLIDLCRYAVHVWGVENHRGGCETSCKAVLRQFQLKIEGFTRRWSIVRWSSSRWEMIASDRRFNKVLECHCAVWWICGINLRRVQLFLEEKTVWTDTHSTKLVSTTNIAAGWAREGDTEELDRLTDGHLMDLLFADGWMDGQDSPPASQLRVFFVSLLLWQQTLRPNTFCTVRRNDE